MKSKKNKDRQEKSYGNIVLSAIIIITIQVLVVSLLSFFVYFNVLGIRDYVLNKDNIYIIFILLLVMVIGNIFFISRYSKKLIKVKSKTDLASAELLGNGIDEAYTQGKLGLIVVDRDRDHYVIIWANTFLLNRYTGLGKTLINSDITEVFPGISTSIDEEFHISDERYYYKVKYFADSGLFIFIDETDNRDLRNKYDNEALVIGTIRIDNYRNDYRLRGNISTLSEIKRVIALYFQKYEVSITQTQEDSFELIFSNESLQDLINDQFSILDEVKKVDKENLTNLVTISIGVATGIPNVPKLQEMCNEALREALARGGDQAVISVFGKNLKFIGGRTLSKSSANNANTTNPDGYINDNNFYVKGDSILNTVNGIVGEFAPKTFDIDAALDYQFDVDLANAKSDTISVTNNNGTLNLSLFNVISDADTDGLEIKYSNTNVNGVVKDDYEITTSEKTYEVTAKNVSDGSYIVFSSTDAGGGLANAIANESNQYIITNNQDEKVTAWQGNNQNNITSDIDINGNNNSIYTENGLDGMVVQNGVNVVLRNVKELSGFNNALTNDGGNLTIVDSNIAGNTGEADITNNAGNITINAETKDVEIGSNETQNALISNGGNIDVKGANKVTFNGNVAGTKDAQMNISTDTEFNGNVSDMNIIHSGGTVDLKDLSKAKYTLNNGTLNLKDSGSFAPDTFELNDGTINISDEAGFLPQANILNGGNINAINSKSGNLNFNSLTLKNVINLAVDIDMNKQIMDTISASSIKGNGMIKVNEFNILSDTNKSRFSIYFANDKLKDHVSTDIKTLEGKIYKYDISYDSKTGRFNIVGGGGSSDGYSPSIMASPVATQIGGYLTQLETLHDGFFHMERYTKYSSADRKLAENMNHYAITETPAYEKPSIPETSQAMWTKPYTTFEKVHLKGGLNVSNVAYGSLFGGDSDLITLKHDWKGVLSAFVGYNGSHQSYTVQQPSIKVISSPV